MITELFPILATPDLERSLVFYRDLLGGTVTYEFAGADGSPVYVGLSLGGSSLGIGVEASVEPASRPRAVSLWVYTDDCDAMLDRLRSAGVRIVEEPADQPWGERVARVLDPDGTEVVIGTRAKTG
jgi:uncharacterized glyoxalase superfamily protein PhnB